MKTDNIIDLTDDVDHLEEQRPAKKKVNNRVIPSISGSSKSTTPPSKSRHASTKASSSTK
jgi:hypothetical protein